jgi:hypothetical protein
MSRFNLLAMALIVLTVSASAQSSEPGNLCHPPVSDSAAYRKCQVQDTGESLVCRCQIMPGVASPQLLVRPRVQLGPSQQTTEPIAVPITGSAP